MGQWEEGYIIDFPLGILYIHTLKKLPNIIPNIKIIKIIK